jgi:hypothetical protein
MFQGRLILRGWLLRGIEVTMPDGVHYVEYDGRYVGYEQVTVDGSLIRTKSWLWFVPRFDFKLGGQPSAVEVRVWPWLLLRSLVLQVGNYVVYAEGSGSANTKRVEPLAREL